MKSSSKSTTPDDNSDDDDDNKRRRLWEVYEITIRNYQERKIRSSPGYFSMSPDERHYQQCRDHPLPRLLSHDDDMIITPHPFLNLPLRINFIRNEFIGCSDALSHSSAVPFFVERVNRYWKQAGISFHHVPTTTTTNDDDDNTSDATLALSTDLSFDDTRLPPTSQRQIQTFIHSLHRNPDGTMANKSQRKRIFLNQLLSHFDYVSRARNCYNVYFLDFTGHGSQGCCIDRSHRTILMGERSDKGYDELTVRPWECLGKTMAHELGHALGLGHPKGRRFEDGARQCGRGGKGRKNLMEGGVDRKGGGGDFLEEWQISLAREEGRRFLGQG